MDFMTDLPPSVKSGVRILLVITDRLNKGTILILILLIFMPAVATAFIEYYVLYHGFPKAIINNRGTQFTNAIWVILCETLGIKYRLFLVHHPEINKVTERTNLIIQPYLQAYIIFSQDN